MRADYFNIGIVLFSLGGVEGLPTLFNFTRAAAPWIIRIKGTLKSHPTSEFSKGQSPPELFL